MGRHRVFDHAEIIRLYEQDHSSSEIAKMLGCGHKLVLDVVKAAGVPKRPGHRRATLDHTGICSAYTAGKSAEQVAEEFQCSKAGVFHVLNLYGIQLRSGGKRHDLVDRLGFEPTAEWLQEQLATHKTVKAMSRALSVPYGTLIDAMERMGVEREVWHGGPGPTGSPTRQEIPVEEAIELSNQGWPYRELATKYGVSEGVVIRRLMEAGYRSPKGKQRRIPEDVIFASAPYSHRKVLHEMGIRVCQLCPNDRILTLAHIVPRRHEGPTVAENAFVLCPSCHHLFDHGDLTEKEKAVLQNKAEEAYRMFGRGRDLSSNPNWAGDVR